jgi:hypothetical protein
LICFIVNIIIILNRIEKLAADGSEKPRTGDGGWKCERVQALGTRTSYQEKTNSLCMGWYQELGVTNHFNFLSN